MDYNAFISYSHEADDQFAPVLHSALHRFGKRWNQRRALHIFRDRANLAAKPDLTQEVTQALDASEFLILLASTQSAKSKWVQKEVGHWIAKNGTDKILIVVTDGKVVWDDKTSDFNWNQTNVLPACQLKRKFRAEPIHVDFTQLKAAHPISKRNPVLLDGVATIAATLHDRPKDEMIGKDLREYRRTRRLIVGVAVAIAVLLSAVIVSLFLYRAAAEDALLKTLASKSAEATSSVTRLRQLQEGPGRANARQEMQHQVGVFLKLKEDFDQSVQKLGSRAKRGASLSSAHWDELEKDARGEVTPWMTTVRLRAGRSITLPSTLDGDVPLAVAIHSSDGAIAELAVLSPGANEAHILDANGNERRRLEVPADVARRAKIVSNNTRRSFNSLRSTTNTLVAPYRLSYEAADRLEYQVAEQLVVWNPVTGARQQDKLERHRPPQPFAGRSNASSDRYTASVTDSDVAVTLRSWEPDSRPVVVWRAAGGDPAGGGERVVKIAFGPDHRSLFILSNTRLAVVDAETGAKAESLLDDASSLRERDLIPCTEGVAIVEQPKKFGTPEPARLVVWNVTLPQVQMRVLHHNAQARCLGVDGKADDRLVSVGTADHLVRTWRGSTLLWESGIPYLGRSNDRPVPDRWQATRGELAEGATQMRRMRQSGPAGDPFVRRYSTDEYGSIPQPYSSWTFLPGGGNNFLVQRPAGWTDRLLPVRTEVYSIVEDGDRLVGRREFAYAEKEDGRLVAIDPHGLYGVCVGEQDDSFLTLKLVRLADRRPLCQLGRYALDPGGSGVERDIPVRASFVAGLDRSDYLLLAQRLSSSGGADLEVWRLTDEPKSVGHIFQPEMFASTFPISDDGRAVVWRTRLGATAPYFAQVIDLSTAKKVCSLEGFETTGVVYQSVMTAKHLVYICHQGLAEDPNDPYRVSVWDLNSGRRTPLDSAPWSSATLPEIEFSPDGRQIAICGTLHETGEAQVRICDLTAASVVGEPWTSPWPAKPRLATMSKAGCVVEVDDYPSQGQRRRIQLSWSSGAELLEPAQEEVLVVQRHVIGSTGGLLCRDGEGLFLQDGYGGKRTRLALSESLGRDTKWLEVPGDVVFWPKPGAVALVLKGTGGGIWRADSGVRLCTFPPGDVCLGLDDEHRWALTFNRKTGAIQVWNAHTGEKGLHCVPGNSPDIPFDPEQSAWKLSPDGRCLAALSQGLLRLWDLKAERVCLIISKAGHSSPVNCLAQHADGGLVASGDDDGLVMLWNRDDGQLRRSILAHVKPVTALAFKPDGSKLASASATGKVSLWSLDGQLTWSFQVKTTTRVTRLAFFPRDEVLCVGTFNGNVILLNSRSGNLLETLHGKWRTVNALDISPDESAIAVGTDDGVQLWYRRERCLRGWATGSPVKAVAFVGDSRWLAIGGKQVQFWDTEAERLVWEWEVAERSVQALALDGSAGALAVVDEGNDVTVLNLPDLVGTLQKFQLGVASLGAKWTIPQPRWGVTPPNRNDWSRRADEHFQRLEWEQLAWVCTTALAQWPREARLWFYLGVAKSHDEQLWNDARADFSTALKLDPGDSRAWKARGDLNQRTAMAGLRQMAPATEIQSQLEAAYQDYCHLIDLTEDDGRLWRTRGLIAALLGKFRMAESDLTQTIERRPDDFVSRHKRGQIRAQLSDWDGATKDLAEVAKLMPYDPAVLREHALASLQNGDDTGFREACAQMLARFGDTDHADAAALVARTCALLPMAERDIESCLSLASRAVAAEPRNPSCTHALAISLFRAGRFEEAADQIVAAIEHGGRGLPQNWYVLTLTCQHAGRLQQAKKFHDVIVQFEQSGQQMRLPWDVRIELICLFQQVEKLMSEGPYD